jgi:MSHA pilin protein MshA
MTKQTGFTLIELVAVIVILSILAAFAIPRFIDLTAKARAADLENLAGDIREASALAHSVVVARGTPHLNGSITLRNGQVTMIDGFPGGGVLGIASALQDLHNFPIYDPGGGNEGDTIKFTVDPPKDKSKCHVAYTAPSHPGDIPQTRLVNLDCH